MAVCIQSSALTRSTSRCEDSVAGADVRLKGEEGEDAVSLMIRTRHDRSAALQSADGDDAKKALLYGMFVKPKRKYGSSMRVPVSHAVASEIAERCRPSYRHCMRVELTVQQV